MPYADPEMRKRYALERNKRPDVMERNRKLYRERYAVNANGLGDKVRANHHNRWSDPQYRETKKQQYVKRWESDWVGQALVQVKSRAKKKGIEFNLTRDDIQLPDKCPIFGTPLVKGVGRLTNDSPSID